MSIENPTVTVLLTSKSRKFIEAQQEITSTTLSRIVNNALEAYREALRMDACPEVLTVQLSADALRALSNELARTSSTASAVVDEAVRTYLSAEYQQAAGGAA